MQYALLRAGTLRTLGPLLLLFLRLLVIGYRLFLSGGFGFLHQKTSCQLRATIRPEGSRRGSETNLCIPSDLFGVFSLGFGRHDDVEGGQMDDKEKSNVWVYGVWAHVGKKLLCWWGEL